jgi:hypothetical protein
MYLLVHDRGIWLLRNRQKWLLINRQRQLLASKQTASDDPPLYLSLRSAQLCPSEG